MWTRATSPPSTPPPPACTPTPPARNAPVSAPAPPRSKRLTASSPPHLPDRKPPPPPRLRPARRFYGPDPSDSQGNPWPELGDPMGRPPANPDRGRPGRGGFSGHGDVTRPAPADAGATARPDHPPRDHPRRLCPAVLGNRGEERRVDGRCDGYGGEDVNANAMSS